MRRNRRTANKFWRDEAMTDVERARQSWAIGVSLVLLVGVVVGLIGCPTI